MSHAPDPLPDRRPLLRLRAALPRRRRGRPGRPPGHGHPARLRVRRRGRPRARRARWRPGSPRPTARARGRPARCATTRSPGGSSAATGSTSPGSAGSRPTRTATGACARCRPGGVPYLAVACSRAACSTTSSPARLPGARRDPATALCWTPWTRSGAPRCIARARGTPHATVSTSVCRASGETVFLEFQLSARRQRCRACSPPGGPGSPAEAATGDAAFLRAMLDAEAALTRAQAAVGWPPPGRRGGHRGGRGPTASTYGSWRCGRGPAGTR